ncbi:unnamed protein product, partial [Polarella glacialis]
MESQDSAAVKRENPEEGNEDDDEEEKRWWSAVKDEGEDEESSEDEHCKYDLQRHLALMQGEPEWEAEDQDVDVKAEDPETGRDSLQTEGREEARHDSGRWEGTFTESLTEMTVQDQDENDGWCYDPEMHAEVERLLGVKEEEGQLHEGALQLHSGPFHEACSELAVKGQEFEQKDEYATAAKEEADLASDASIPTEKSEEKWEEFQDVKYEEEQDEAHDEKDAARQWHPGQFADESAVCQTTADFEATDEFYKGEDQEHKRYWEDAVKSERGACLEHGWKEEPSDGWHTSPEHHHPGTFSPENRTTTTATTTTTTIRNNNNNNNSNYNNMASSSQNLPRYRPLTAKQEVNQVHPEQSANSNPEGRRQRRTSWLADHSSGPTSAARSGAPKLIVPNLLKLRGAATEFEGKGKGKD